MLARASYGDNKSGFCDPLQRCKLDPTPKALNSPETGDRMAATESQFDLRVSIESKVSSPYRTLVKSNEWVRGIRPTISISIKNVSKRVFPGSTVSVSYAEKGTSRASVNEWSFAREPDIPELQPDEEFAIGEFRPLPMIEGLVELEIRVDNVDDQPVRLTGYRSPSGTDTIFKAWYYVCSRELLDIRRTLNTLSRRMRQ